jgi:peptide/nickel transport system permease protein
MIIVATVVYFVTSVLPGDVATRILGRSPDPEQLSILRERLGLNAPVMTRFADWLFALLRGDLGNSLVTGQPVAPYVGKAFWNSSLMALFVLALYVPLTIIPATIQALRVDSAVDNAYSGFSLAVQSIPDFLLGTILLLIFARWLPILPARSTIDSANTTWEIVRALVLPGVTIALVMATYATRFLRDSLIDVLNSDYVKMARLNGISERAILWRHAFPNALVPAMTVTSLSLTYLFGGVVVVEQVFSFPGIGQLLIGALMQLDVPVIQATVLIASGVYIAGNLLVDVLTLYFNPRLRQL